MPEAQQKPKEAKGRPDIDPIIDVFAFFAAMRNYGYVDILGNALERTTALEALATAIRDFRSTCLDATPAARARLEKEEGVRCPSIGAEELQRAVEAFSGITAKLESEGRLVPFLREIYVKALSRASRFKAGGEA